MIDAILGIIATAVMLIVSFALMVISSAEMKKARIGSMHGFVMMLMIISSVLMAMFSCALMVAIIIEFIRS